MDDNLRAWVEIVAECSSPEVAEIVASTMVSVLGRGVREEEREADGGIVHVITGYLDGRDMEQGLLEEMEKELSGLDDFFCGSGGVRFHTGVLPPEDWHQGWKKYFKPVKVGSRIVVKPSWEPYVPGRDELVLDIDPGQAFGTGTHATTSMVLEEMESLWQERQWSPPGPGTGVESAHAGAPRVLDVGTGTGILAMAAARLGAGEVVGLDVDPVAVEAARENVMRNGLHGRVSVSTTPLWKLDQTFTVVLANLDRDTIVLLSKDLARRVEPGGVMILSGILVEQVERVTGAMEESGLILVKRVEDDRGEWACLRLEPVL